MQSAALKNTHQHKFAFQSAAGDLATTAKTKDIEGRQAAVSTDLDFSLITDRAGFDDLDAEWSDLFQRAGHPGNPFQSFNWCWHWANHFLGGKAKCQLSVLTGRIHGRLVMVWPLVKEHSNGLSKLTWLGTPVTQYGDVLMDDIDRPARLRTAWNYLRTHARVDLVELYKVREDAAVAPLLAEIQPVLTHKDTAPYADLSQGETYADHFREKSSKKRRNAVKRYRRRFEEMGPVRLEVHDEGEEAYQLTRQLLDMKEEWQAAKSIVSRALDDPRTRQFFEATARNPDKKTGVRLVTLHCGDELIAADLDYVAKGGSIAHVITYKLEYEKWSPGHLLAYMDLENAKQTGLHTFDFMAPWARFKMDWSDATIEVNDWAIPLSMKGSLWARIYLGFARDRLKKLYLSLPASIKKFSAKKIAAAVIAG